MVLLQIAWCRSSTEAICNSLLAERKELNFSSMVLIHIITKYPERAYEIADLLIEQKLLLDAVIDDKVFVREKHECGEFRTDVRIRLMGRTKALLFDEIDKKLRETYPDDMPLLYSVPIVHMDWEQSDQLISNTAKV